MWVAFIGWFLDSAASAQINQAVYQGLLTGHSVSQAMSTQCVSIPADLTLQQLVDEHVLGTGRRCFLVTGGTATTGLMTLHRIKEVSRADWPTTSVSQAMLPLDELKHVNPATDLFEALQLLVPEGVNQLPVMTGGQVVGMLSREDVISYLRTLQELATAGTTSR
jgi:predicted transcriptional regulator